MHNLLAPVASLVDTIHASGFSLLSLIDHMLDRTMVEAGDLPLVAAPACVVASLTGAMPAMAATHARVAGGPSPPTIAEAIARGRLILVAEDDVVSQKVVLKQLGLLGYAAEVAPDGAAALALWKTARHALVLTDLHMPVLDGYGLARAIRGEEAALVPPRRIPMLALTANALRDGAGPVLAAGMDEYLTKPIRLATLGAALGRWLPPPHRGDVADAAAGIRAGLASTDPVVDVSILMSLIGDDRIAVRDLLAAFLESARSQSAELVASCIAADHARVGAVAHKLKASSRSVGALALGELCAELESASRDALPGLDERRERFEAAMRAVEATIVRTLAEPFV